MPEHLAAQPLAQYFKVNGWPGSQESLRVVTSWLAQLQLSVVLDLVDLGDVRDLPGAQLLEPEVSIFLQKQVEVWRLLAFPASFLC